MSNHLWSIWHLTTNTFYNYYCDFEIVVRGRTAPIVIREVQWLLNSKISEHFNKRVNEMHRLLVLWWSNGSPVDITGMVDLKFPIDK